MVIQTVGAPGRVHRTEPGRDRKGSQGTEGARGGHDPEVGAEGGGRAMPRRRRMPVTLAFGWNDGGNAAWSWLRSKQHDGNLNWGSRLEQSSTE